MIYRLKSSDGEIFEVDESVVAQSQVIKHLIEDKGADDIPLLNVTSKILAKVIEYCKRHVDAASKADTDGAVTAAAGGYEDLKAFDAEFVKVDQSTLYEIILAANDLSIKSLLDLTFKTVADMMKGKTPNQLREIFLID